MLIANFPSVSTGHLRRDDLRGDPEKISRRFQDARPEQIHVSVSTRRILWRRRSSFGAGDDGAGATRKCAGCLAPSSSSLRPRILSRQDGKWTAVFRSATSHRHQADTCCLWMQDWVYQTERWLREHAQTKAEGKWICWIISRPHANTHMHAQPKKNSPGRKACIFNTFLLSFCVNWIFKEERHIRLFMISALSSSVTWPETTINFCSFNLKKQILKLTFFYFRIIARLNSH